MNTNKETNNTIPKDLSLTYEVFLRKFSSLGLQVNRKQAMEILGLKGNDSLSELEEKAGVKGKPYGPNGKILRHTPDTLWSLFLYSANRN